MGSAAIAVNIESPAGIDLGTGASTLSAAQGCTWIQDTRNQVLPETHAIYYRASPPSVLPAGSYIRIRGSFVDARYESFQLYDGLTLSNDGSLSDYKIVPDDGSVNPAINRSERDSAIPPGGQYTINIRFEVPPPNPAANTLYTAKKPGSELITLRRYVSSISQPLPAIEVVNADGTVQPFGTPLNNVSCATTQSLIALGTLPVIKNIGITAQAGSAIPDQPFSVYYGNGVAQNQDARYLSVILPRTANYLIVRGRAPTSPGYRNSSVPNFRYWSFCSYNYIAETVVGCTADYEIRIDSSGFYYVVLTADAVAMSPGAAAQFSILPMGTEEKFWLIMRQILDDPSFFASANKVPEGVDPETVMGDYLPIARTCPPAVFNTAVTMGGDAQSIWNACLAM